MAFNVGFRTENCIEEFEKYRRGEEPSALVVEDTLNLLEGVYSIASRKEGITECIVKYGIDTLERYLMIIGDYPGLTPGQTIKTHEDRTKGLEKTVTALTQIRDKQDVKEEDIDYSLGFLKDLSRRCLAYQSKETRSRRPAIFDTDFSDIDRAILGTDKLKRVHVHFPTSDGNDLHYPITCNDAGRGYRRDNPW